MKYVETSWRRVQATYTQHMKKMMQYNNAVYIHNIDPRYWMKKITITYNPVDEGVKISLRLYFHDSNRVDVLKKWWIRWVNDYARFIESDSFTPSYTGTGNSNEMREELLVFNLFNNLSIVFYTWLGFVCLYVASKAPPQFFWYFISVYFLFVSFTSLFELVRKIITLK